MPIGGDIPPAPHRPASSTAQIRTGPPWESAGAFHSFNIRPLPHGHVGTGAPPIVGAAGSASSAAAD